MKSELVLGVGFEIIRSRDPSREVGRIGWVKNQENERYSKLVPAILILRFRIKDLLLYYPNLLESLPPWYNIDGSQTQSVFAGIQADRTRVNYVST
jgi:hypothetical protein